MNNDELVKLAYSMEQAYMQRKTQGEAIEQVRDEHTGADLEILWAMWAAIDAYVDVNT